MRPAATTARALLSAGIAALACGHQSTAGAERGEIPQGLEVLARRALSAGADSAEWLLLVRDREGNGYLYRDSSERGATKVACDPLPGAWGLWAEDVDGDRAVEAVVALRKRAPFDPVLENRLFVYALAGDRCVPLWRGTRLAGRFDRVKPDAGQLLALERVGRGRRRVARYHWTGFGYALDKVLWLGAGMPPKRLLLELNR